MVLRTSPIGCATRVTVGPQSDRLFPGSAATRLL
jgi:hypothetical protein